MSNLVSAGPSYVFGYWRPWNENSDAFNSFMDYTKDMSLANYTASAIGSYLEQASADQVDAINSLADELGIGMKILSIELDKINIKAEKTNKELQFLNRNMDVQIEHQRLSNLLLQNITELLRVPDSEKERQQSIEWGIKFMVNAQKDPDLFKDALEELHKAEELRKQDYFVLHRLGMIYLYATNFMNPEKALNYFETAAKYASVESDPKAIRLANVLVGTDDEDAITNIQHMAADSFKKAALAAYAIGKFDVAEINQNKALELNETSENTFLLAKYMVRNDNIRLAIKCLDSAISSSPALFEGVFRDLDLINDPNILDFLKKKNDSINLKIQQVINKEHLTEGDIDTLCGDNFNSILKSSYTNKIKVYKSLQTLNRKVKTVNNKIEYIVKELGINAEDHITVFVESLQELKSLDYPEKQDLYKKISFALKTWKKIFSKNNHLQYSFDNKSIKINALYMHYKEFIELVESIERKRISWMGWADENLNVSSFRNGAKIFQAKTAEEWGLAHIRKQPAWCWPSRKTAGEISYGKLYNHYAVRDLRGLAPKGYRIPTEDELKSLIKVISGLSLPLAGQRSSIYRIYHDNSYNLYGSLDYVGSEGAYWSIDLAATGGYARYLNVKNKKAETSIQDRGYGLSVRCIKD